MIVKVCKKHGGLSLEDVKVREYPNGNSTYSCKECLNDANLRYRKNHPEKVKANRDKYYVLNKEKRDAEAKQWKKDNKEKVNAQAKAWRLRNPDKVKAKNKSKYAKNKEYFLRKHKEWKEKNREHVKEYAKNNWHKYRQKALTRNKIYRTENKDQYNQDSRNRHKRNIDNLTDSYIRKALTWGTPFKCADIPPIMIELKRVTLKIRRVKLNTLNK